MVSVSLRISKLVDCIAVLTILDILTTMIVLFGGFGIELNPIFYLFGENIFLISALKVFIMALLIRFILLNDKYSEELRYKTSIFISIVLAFIVTNNVLVYV